MKQRTAFIITIALTAFILVLVGGVTASLTQSNTVQGQATVAPTGTPLPPQPTPVAPTTATADTISADRAAVIALDAAAGSRLTQTPELVNFEGVVVYEVLLDQGSIYVDAQTGTILHNGVAVPPVNVSAPDSQGEVSREQAIQVAIEYAGGGDVHEVELENERGRRVYEIELTDGSEIYVDATTGQVVYAELRNAGQTSENAEYEYKESDDGYEEYDEEEEYENEYEEDNDDAY
ncbi:MAG: peptidase [Chloroflexi bacterium AL-W]|nr:peptidase [Chloroflexi bacterium AL-N1]NOK70719.1 peptidase [Chloroflexi bacterium AL-N10]NOK78279.1 peptidase [Chloroflexi bacterium AL-N5]NOK85622.1 peptidase [Chloroflexi bacterium AL-W]NOK92536.1 peptidase [Chloroflexi bacterium AL-N15]